MCDVLSKPQHNLTQPQVNSTNVGFDIIIGLQQQPYLDAMGFDKIEINPVGTIPSLYPVGTIPSLHLVPMPCIPIYSTQAQIFLQ